MRPCRLACLTVLATALSLAWARADGIRLPIVIGRSGEVSAAEAGPTVPPRPGNVVGSTPVHDPRFVTQGPDIEGAFCKQFGFEFRTTDLPGPLALPVDVRLDHPQWQLPDGQTSTQETNDSSVSSDRWSYTGYTLEEPFSLVAGPWTFTILSGDIVLAVVTFNVTVEPGQHMPSSRLRRADVVRTPAGGWIILVQVCWSRMSRRP